MFEHTWCRFPYQQRYQWEMYMLICFGKPLNSFFLSMMWEPLAVAVYSQARLTIIDALGTEMTALDVFGEI